MQRQPDTKQQDNIIIYRVDGVGFEGCFILATDTDDTIHVPRSLLFLQIL